MLYQPNRGKNTLIYLLLSDIHWEFLLQYGRHFFAVLFELAGAIISLLILSLPPYKFVLTLRVSNVSTSFDTLTS
jgi:hypothetical protein